VIALPFVSVVAPALDCAGDIDGFVRALRAQSYPAERFEVIVADNGSRDDTVAKLEANRIRHVTRAERGRSRALNAGLGVARGEIVCTTDLSCRPHPDWIRRVVQCFDDPSIGCVAGEIVLAPEADTLALRFQRRSNYMSAMYAASRLSLPFLPFADGANASFRRAVFEEIGPFDESFFKGADVEICYRMLVQTRCKIAFCREAVVEEAGEPTLRALLKQRFRIGMGTNLMEAKYPDLYRASPRSGAFRRTYWSAVRFVSVGRWSRADLEDGLVRLLMSWSQRLGRWYGRRYLERQSVRPVSLESRALRRFIADLGMLSERVLIR
jgi:cellulose synthase/poly-beta-1,6-N-acetylglucosamine synthase-like glycosyltransferase